MYIYVPTDIDRHGFYRYIHISTYVSMYVERDSENCAHASSRGGNVQAMTYIWRLEDKNAEPLHCCWI